MERTVINTKNAPAAIGPYSQAIRVGDMLYTSGQIPLNAITGEMVTESIEKATEMSLENLKAILEEAGTNLDNVIKTTVFLKNMDDFVKMNEVYAKYFTSNPPARSAVQVAKLPKDALVEIEAIALIK